MAYLYVLDRKGKSMSALLTSLGSVVTQVFSWLPDMFDTIVDTPLLLLAVGISITGVVIGMAIGIFKRV